MGASDGARGRRRAVAWRGWTAVVLCGGLLAACASSADDRGSVSPGATTPATAPSASSSNPPSGSAFPGAEWETVDPAAAGFDPAELERLAADAEAAGSNCMAVVRDGKLAASWYWNGTGPDTTQNVYSATKSVTSALVGIVQEDGGLDVQQDAASFIPQWRGTPAEAVTVEDLLSNDSGRHWDAATDYRDLLAAPDRTAFAVGLAQDHAPGETWVYNNAAIQTLDAVLSAAGGEATADLAQQRLLDPLGMAHSSMSRDAAGGTATYFGLRSTCEDMARFGLLYLEHGSWDGHQVVPSDWVAASVGQPSQPLNAAYGYLWWLNRTGSVVSNPMEARTAAAAASAPPGQLVPGAPDDMFWAIGLGGQIVQVDPTSRTVVVRLGPGSVTSRGGGPGGAGGYGPDDTARVVTEALSGPPASTTAH